jgi:hypothetical protein
MSHAMSCQRITPSTPPIFKGHRINEDSGVNNALDDSSEGTFHLLFVNTRCRAEG